MKLRTEITLPRIPLKINHQDRILMMGSCFTESIGNWLRELKFLCHLNPFGITFSDRVLATQIEHLLHDRKIT